MLHVDACLGRSLDEQILIKALLFRHADALLTRDLSVFLVVNLVADEDYHHVIAAVLSSLGYPHANVLETGTILKCQIIESLTGDIVADDCDCRVLNVLRD